MSFVSTSRGAAIAGQHPEALAADRSCAEMSGAAPVSVHELTPSGIGVWNDYVERHREATFFHRAEWGALVERVYGHRTCYLYAQHNGRCCGVLPLMHMRSALFGNSLCSTPFAVYGGVVADTPAIAEMLEDRAAELAQARAVDHLELRNLRRTRAGWPGKSLYVTFRKEIDPDAERNLLAIPRKQRAMVRKGLAAGLVADIDDDVERFFRIYATSVRDHGTPVFPKRWFAALKQTFGERCEVLVVTRAGQPVSAVMSFYFRDEVLPYYGGGLAAARECKAFDFMYWDLMRRACARGVRVFDYGRSKEGTGSYSFKKNWGFEPQPLPYQYHLVRARTIPDVNPLNPKYRAFIAIWQRLPVPLANAIGPFIARGLG